MISEGQVVDIHTSKYNRMWHQRALAREKLKKTGQWPKGPGKVIPFPKTTIKEGDVVQFPKKDIGHNKMQARLRQRVREAGSFIAPSSGGQVVPLKKAVKEQTHYTGDGNPLSNHGSKAEWQVAINKVYPEAEVKEHEGGCTAWLNNRRVGQFDKFKNHGVLFHKHLGEAWNITRSGLTYHEWHHKLSRAGELLKQHGHTNHDMKFTHSKKNKTTYAHIGTDKIGHFEHGTGRGSPEDLFPNHRTEETIQELSNRTLSSYMDKAVTQAVNHSMLGQKRQGDARQHVKVAKKRFLGIYKASKKLNNEETITELSAKTLQGYLTKASKQTGKANQIASPSKTDKRRQGVDTAAKKVIAKEEILNEKIPAGADSGTYVDDFVHSKNKMFAGDSKKQRIKRALAAYYASK